MKASVIMNVCEEKEFDMARAIDSYLSQDVQLIVSTLENDKCISFIKRNYPQIELVITKKKDHPGRSPQGSFTQLNNALPLIKTDWFCFASSNDTALFNKISLEISACERTGKKICYSAFHTTDENMNNTGTRFFHDYDFQRHKRGNFVSDCALMHRSIVEKYLPFKLELNNYAYWDLWLRVYEGEGNVFVYNPIPTWNYRISENSMHIKRRSDPEQMAKYKQDELRMLKLHE